MSSDHRGARVDYRRAYRALNPGLASERIIGIDGEGQGRRPHLYNYLAAADEQGTIWSVGDNPRRQLTTEQCLDFLLELPVKSIIFGYAFLYDLTKILTDLPDNLLYLLFHEDRRALIYDNDKGGKEVRYRPVRWNGYKLNFMHRKFTVEAAGTQRAVWDIFAFFQSKFTKACIDWKIGNEETIGAMEVMKERRASFDAQSWTEVRTYCQTECLHLAQLGRNLITAHEDAGYKLKSYFGAGSTASALLKQHDVKRWIGTIPDDMKEGIACAFFGGRFENSVTGPVNRPVWNADINSAYPYAATFLPCLIHGRWRKLTRGLDRAIDESRLALIQWTLPEPSANYCQSWGPLPVRTPIGSIVFPLGASSAWTWKEEYLAARRLRPDVDAMCAWLYDSDCACQPFAFLPEVYLERLKLGKDSKGIVLKLGPSSVYGKLVQSVGIDPPFQSWVWGSNITSTCRSMLLDAIRLAPDPSNVLMLATDGVWSDCPIELPAPRETGTGHTPKPLGGWDIKQYPSGVFAARPGIYFPLNPTKDDMSKVRARGLGRKLLYEQYRLVQSAYACGQDEVLLGLAYSDVQTKEARAAAQRFVGSRTAMSFTPKGGVKRSEDYGEWVDYPTEVTFDPRPKRRLIRENGTLECWPYLDAASCPYEPALKDPEGKLLELAEIIAGEQPDVDFSEYDIGEWEGS